MGVPLSSPFQTQSSYFPLKFIYPLNLEENVSNAARCSENRPKTINEGRVGWLRIWPYAHGPGIFFALDAPYKLLLIGNLTISSRKSCLSLLKKKFIITRSPWVGQLQAGESHASRFFPFFHSAKLRMSALPSASSESLSSTAAVALIWCPISERSLSLSFEEQRNLYQNLPFVPVPSSLPFTSQWPELHFMSYLSQSLPRGMRPLGFTKVRWRVTGNTLASNILLDLL